MHNVTTWSDEDEHTPLDAATGDGTGPLEGLDLDEDLPPEPGDDAADAEPYAAESEPEPEPAVAVEPRRRTRERARRGKRSSIDKYRDLVGVMTDAEVAEKAGVTSSAVAQYRTRRGITAALPQGSTRRAQKLREASERRTPSKPPRAPSPARSAPAQAAPARQTKAPATPARQTKARAPSAPSDTPFAWKITLALRGQVTERVVVAGSASEACEIASRHGDVVSATRLCPAL